LTGTFAIDGRTFRLAGASRDGAADPLSLILRFVQCHAQATHSSEPRGVVGWHSLVR
jgi:hypothetical protein